MKLLNWKDFNSCINDITSACKDKQFSGVYGFPRGGLCLAVALSHSLNIPYLEELRPSCLVVDDVYETGKTLKIVLDYSNITVFVWFSKVQPSWWNAVQILESKDWLLFPWENPQCVEKDKNLFEISRMVPATITFFFIGGFYFN